MIAEFSNPLVGSRRPELDGDSPWSDQMGNREQCPENDAQAADGDIGNPQKGVLSTDDGPCGDQDALSAVVDGHREDCVRSDWDKSLWVDTTDNHRCPFDKYLRSWFHCHCGGQVC